jgi:hypothetical protein
MRKSNALLTVIALLFAAATSQASSISGTVTNKTNGKPSAGDAVDLVDMQAGMASVAHTITDANGHYTLNNSGMGSYLIRVNHQGGTYFTGLPQAGAAKDVTVYDVAAKVEGVSIDSDLMLLETASGMLRVHERFVLRNTSQPPRAQFSKNTFEVVLPPGAVLETASTTRPAGIATNTSLVPLSQKGHYTFNVPIQPDKGENGTLFELLYHIPYNGKFTFSPQVLMPTNNLVVYLTKGISFKGASGSQFEARQDDPRVETWVAKNVHPGQVLSFTISGEGKMPDQPAHAGQPSMGNSPHAGVTPDGHPTAGTSSPNEGSSAADSTGTTVVSPDPLNKYKWPILSVLALLLVGAAAFLLRKRSAPASTASADSDAADAPSAAPPSNKAAAADATSGTRDASLNSIKEELFALESKRLSGTLSESDYIRIKTELEIALKRALADGQ